MSSIESNNRAAEVIVVFEETVVAVRHLLPGERYTVGAAAADDLPWAEDGVASSELFRVTPSGAIEIYAQDRLPIVTELLDGESRALPSESLHYLEAIDTGARVATLPLDRRCKLQLGQVTLLVSQGRAPERRELPPPIDWRAHTTTAATALAFLIMLAGINALPPGSSSLAIDPFLLSLRGVHTDFVPPVEPPSPNGELANAAGGAPAPAHKAMVPRRAVTTGSSNAPGKRATTAQRKLDAAEAASTMGVLGVMRAIEGTHAGAIFHSGSALGDAGEAMGELTGTMTGDADGTAAIDRMGARTGRGGDGTVGLGPVGGKPGQGYSSCAHCTSTNLHGRSVGTINDDFGGTHSEVHGPIDKEIIRRAVRAIAPQFRFCYEQELQHHADLAGRIITKFTIAGNGKVVASMTQSSTVGNQTVDACVANVFRRLQLPAMPSGTGLAIVTYPIAFKIAGQ